MPKLEQFVPEKICLACDGCCRYSEKRSVWAPVFLFEEIASAVSNNLLPCSVFTHPGCTRGQAAKINLIEESGSFFCPCLDGSTNKCKIYFERPFDCQLYPFLLARKNDQVFLAADNNCPYIQKMLSSQAGKDYVRTLKEFFASQETLKWMKDNAALIQEYPEEGLLVLTALPGLTMDLYGPASAHHTR